MLFLGKWIIPKYRRNSMVQIAPSLLAANAARLGSEIRKIERAGADLIHWDIMDGHFVPNLTFGPHIVKQLRSVTDLPFDVHLMLSRPQAFVKPFAQAGADLITVHLECEDHLADTIDLIKKQGCRAGIAIRPKTNISQIIPYLPMIDLVLVMSVEPGFGGQAFQKEALDKIAGLRDLIGTKKVLISVDGGVNAVTASACRLAGADILVAGSAVFGPKNTAEAIERLKHD